MPGKVNATIGNVALGGSRHTGLAAPPHGNIHIS